MSDFRTLAARLRREAGYREAQPVALDVVLPRLYPVAIAVLPDLSVSRIGRWLTGHHAGVPPGLVTCRDRRLRGAVIARRGYGLICADAADSTLEQRFTFAHEAAHFLGEHLYPRQDLLQRYGDSIRPVLDGDRDPTPTECVDALLGRTSLTLQTHLLERGGGLSAPLRSAVDAAEADADAFACEILAPTAALGLRFPTLRADDNAVAVVTSVLTGEFGLPPTPAVAWSRRFVARHGEPVTLLHRLRLA